MYTHVHPRVYGMSTQVLHELAGHATAASSSTATPPSRASASIHDLEDGLGGGMISLASFSKWMMSTYMSYLKDPSLVADSTATWADYAVYNQ